MKIVNVSKNKFGVSNILDSLLTSRFATFIVVFLGPLLSIITFLAFSITEELLQTRVIIGDHYTRFVIHLNCRNIDLIKGF